MPIEIFLILGLFLMGTAVYLFVSNLLGSNEDQVNLSWAAGDEPDKSKSNFIEFSRPLAHRFSMNLVSKIKSPFYRQSVEKKIKTAGLSRELNVDEFIGIQILWGVFFPVMILIFNIAMQANIPSMFFPVFAVVGFLFPHMYCQQQRNFRTSAILLDLPFFIDLLALSMQAGKDFTGSISKLVEYSEKSILADELGRVLQDINLGRSLKEALIDFSDRVEMSEITSFVAIINDAQETGASLGKVLKDQSEQIRLERFARAEKAGAKASQMIIFPLIVIFVPMIFLMIMAPIGIRFLTGG